MPRKKNLLAVKRRQRLTKFIIVFGIFFFLVLIYWFIFLSNFFQITEIDFINYKGPNKEIILSEINNYFKIRNNKFVPQIIFKIFPQFQKNQKNMLLFSAERLSLYLKEKQPEFKEVKPVLDIGKQTLKIGFILREADYLYCQDNKDCYFLDNEGIVFSKAPEITSSLLKKIISTKPQEIILGKAIIGESLIKKIENFYKLTERKGSPFKINYFEIDPDNYSKLTIKTQEGWLLYINPNDDFEYLLKIIGQLKAEKDFSRINYLDCRFLPKIYLK